MLTSLDHNGFFTQDETIRLASLGLWSAAAGRRASHLAMGGLMLAPVMQIVVRDNATTAAEFASVRGFLGRLEGELGLATLTDLEQIGTSMGLLPMLPATWGKTEFSEARCLLAAALDRLGADDAVAARNILAEAALDVARAGSPHAISLRMVDDAERTMLRALIDELHLERSPQGMALLEQVS